MLYLFTIYLIFYQQTASWWFGYYSTFTSLLVKKYINSLKKCNVTPNGK